MTPEEQEKAATDSSVSAFVNSFSKVPKLLPTLWADKDLSSKNVLDGMFFSAILALLVVPSYGAVDYMLLAHVGKFELLYQCWGIRLVIVVSCGLFIFCTHNHTKKPIEAQRRSRTKQLIIMGIMTQQLIALGMTLLTIRMGGSDHGYYAGLMMVFIGVTVMNPWRPLFTGIHTFTMFAMFLISVSMLDSLSINDRESLSNILFLAGGFVVSIVGASTYHNRLRERVINLPRLQEFDLRLVEFNEESELPDQGEHLVIVGRHRESSKFSIKIFGTEGQSLLVEDSNQLAENSTVKDLENLENVVKGIDFSKTECPVQRQTVLDAVLQIFRTGILLNEEDRKILENKKQLESAQTNIIMRAIASTGALFLTTGLISILNKVDAKPPSLGELVRLVEIRNAGGWPESVLVTNASPNSIVLTNAQIRLVGQAPYDVGTAEQPPRIIKPKSTVEIFTENLSRGYTLNRSGPIFGAETQVSDIRFNGMRIVSPPQPVTTTTP